MQRINLISPPPPPWVCIPRIPYLQYHLRPLWFANLTYTMLGRPHTLPSWTPRVCIRRIHRTRNDLQSLGYVFPLFSPPPPPSSMHTALSPAQICFKLYRVCIPHILHVTNDFISPPYTLGLAYPAILR